MEDHRVLETHFQQLAKHDVNYQNLLGLAEKALHRAQINSGESAIEWYVLAIRIYDELQNRQKSFSVSSGDWARLRLISLLGITHEKSSPYIEDLLEVIRENLSADKQLIQSKAQVGNRWTWKRSKSCAG